MVALAVIVGGGVRLLHLGRRDFWYDESWTHYYVKHLFDWPAGSSLLAECTNLPYYLALRGWTAWFGWSEASYRSMSAIAGILTIPLLAAAAGRLRGPTAAGLCAWIVALHPLHVYYSREARAYAVWVLFLSLALWLLLRALERPTWRRWGVWAASVSLCLFTHYFSALWAVASWAMVAGLQRSDARLRRWFVAMIAAFAPFTPYLLLAVLPYARGGGTAWIAEGFDPTWLVPWSLWVFLPAAAYPPNLQGLSFRQDAAFTPELAWLVSATEALPLCVLGGLLMAFALRRRRRATETAASRREDDESPARGAGPGKRPLPVSRSMLACHLVLGGMTIGPLVMAWTYSVVVRPVYLVGRYDLVSWPAAMVWLATALLDASHRFGGRGRATALVCAGVMTTCSLVPLSRLLKGPPGPSFARERASRLAERCGPGDFVVAFSYDRGELLYYLDRAAFRGTIVSYPARLDDQVGWIDTRSDLEASRRDEWEQDAKRLVDRMRGVWASGGAVRLLVDRTDPLNAGARGPINRTLLRALAGAEISIEPEDESTLILLLRPERTDPES